MSLSGSTAAVDFLSDIVGLNKICERQLNHQWRCVTVGGLLTVFALSSCCIVVFRRKATLALPVNSAEELPIPLPESGSVMMEFNQTSTLSESSGQSV